MDAFVWLTIFALFWAVIISLVVWIVRTVRRSSDCAQKEHDAQARP